MTTTISTADLKRRMHGAVEALKHDLGGLRTGRASTALLDPVHVEVYGANMPLNQVATVSTPEARMLSVQVWDRSNVQPVEKAIRSAGLGLNPITDGQLIRLPIPELTEERRKELAKLVGQYAEKARIAVRNVRRDGMDHLKQDEKKHEISEDERKRLEHEVQKLTDDTIKRDRRGRRRPRNRKSSASEPIPSRSSRAKSRDVPTSLDTNGSGVAPRHVAIIMDGNGRWAEQRGLPRVAGHRAGAEAVRKAHPGRRRPRRRGAHDLRILVGELAPKRRGDRRPHGVDALLSRPRARRRSSGKGCGSS